MGKWIVIGLAVCAAMALVYRLAGHSLGNTALNVPGSEHTPTFGISWAFIVGGVLCFAFYKMVKK